MKIDIYTHKTNFKLILVALAAAIVAVTVWYSNSIANKIAKEEENKVTLWAEAIVKKAKLVKYTNQLFASLAEDERIKAELWAEATKLVITIDDSKALTFATDIIQSNKKIPVILTHADREIVTFRNVEFPGIKDSTYLRNALLEEFSDYPPIPVDYISNRDYIYYKDSKLFEELKEVLNDLIESFISEVVINSANLPVILTDENYQPLQTGNVDTTNFNDQTILAKSLSAMADQNAPIEIDLGDGRKRYLYYENSYLLTQLKYFPIVQLVTIFGFLIIAYLAFSSARRSEQNRVWVGMAKETAHQLGTPISSLSAWIEYIRETPEEERGDEKILDELQKDVNRLALVADRFSKIGSKPDLKPESARDICHSMIDYYRKRASQKVNWQFQCEPEMLTINVNRQLFEWVLENLLKNALDAMSGKGSIKIKAHVEGNKVVLDVTDSGKGMPKSKFNDVFRPGFSTKQRGWGLGLSLSKRIIENYHNGKIFVFESVLNKGTTFRILLPLK